MKNCIHCGHPVSQGDRHSKGNCPPKFLGENSQKARRRAKRKKARRLQAHVPERGMTVAGTGVPKGASKG